MQTANITVKKKSEFNNSPKRKHLKDSLLQRKQKLAFTRAMDEELGQKYKYFLSDELHELPFDLLDDTNDSEPATNKSLCALGKTIKHIMLEICEIQESNHERRHREHMELLEKYLKHQAGKDDVETRINFKVGFDPELGGAQHYTENKYDYIGVPIPSAEGIEGQSDIEEQIKSAMITEDYVEETSPNFQIGSTVFVKNVNSEAKAGDFKLMRDRMLEMQRQKMEDRERKNVKYK